MQNNFWDVIIIGAGAAGLMCAIEAGKRKRHVLVIDHANKAGKKILMSGGGRCNFTNYYIQPENYISHNPHFCKSALTRYTQWDFIKLINKHQIPFHEKTLGQLFCDNKSKDVLNMLLQECLDAGVKIWLNTKVNKINLQDNFNLATSSGMLTCESLVIATGGLSIPTLGATPFAYQVAEQFGIKVWPTRAGLVPVTWDQKDKNKMELLAGISVPSSVSNKRITFKENILFTHRGLSGPAILQMSSYWEVGEMLNINLLPEVNVKEFLKLQRLTSPQKQLNTILNTLLPTKIIENFFSHALLSQKIANVSDAIFTEISQLLNAWCIKPQGTEGYRTAEVTLGGIDCHAVSSKTMEAMTIKNLYFIGEALDVTGWLGGYNFQWAWSSGWAAGQVV